MKLNTEKLSNKWGEIKLEVVTSGKNWRNAFLRNEEKVLQEVFVFFDESVSISKRLKNALDDVKKGSLLGKTVKNAGFSIRKQDIESQEIYYALGDKLKLVCPVVAYTFQVSEDNTSFVSIARVIEISLVDGVAISVNQPLSTEVISKNEYLNLFSSQIRD